MGLGKTLEVISLLLAHPSAVPRSTEPKFTSVVSCVCGATEEDDKAMVQCDDCLKWQHCDCVEFDASASFYCRDCISFVSQPPVPSRSTLIICPASILEQWRDEIRKHTAPGSLQVYVYKSVRDQGQLVHPRKLLNAGMFFFC